MLSPLRKTSSSPAMAMFLPQAAGMWTDVSSDFDKESIAECSEGKPVPWQPQDCMWTQEIQPGFRRILSSSAVNLTQFASEGVEQEVGRPGLRKTTSLPAMAPFVVLEGQKWARPVQEVMNAMFSPENWEDIRNALKVSEP